MRQDSLDGTSTQLYKFTHHRDLSVFVRSASGLGLKNCHNERAKESLAPKLVQHGLLLVHQSWCPLTK